MPWTIHSVHISKETGAKLATPTPGIFLCSHDQAQVVAQLGLNPVFQEDPDLFQPDPGLLRQDITERIEKRVEEINAHPVSRVEKL